MLTFLVTSRHTPADCALWNEKSAKIYAAFMSKQAELEAKHGVKMVGGWNVNSEHFTVQVFEAPSFEAFMAFSMEPEVMNIANVDTMEIKLAMTLEEAGRMMQQMQAAK